MTVPACLILRSSSYSTFVEFRVLRIRHWIVGYKVVKYDAKTSKLSFWRDTSELSFEVFASYFSMVYTRHTRQSEWKARWTWRKIVRENYDFSDFLIQIFKVAVLVWQKRRPFLVLFKHCLLFLGNMKMKLHYDIHYIEILKKLIVPE